MTDSVERAEVVRNVSWSLVSKTAGIVVRLVAVAVLTRVLGPAEFGQFVWVLSTTALLVIFADLGTSASVSRFIAEKPAIAAALIRRSSYLIIAATVLISFALVGLADRVGVWLNTPWLGSLSLYVTGALLSQVGLRYFSKVFEGLAQHAPHGRVHLAVGWLPWALSIAAVLAGLGVKGALGGYIAGNGVLCAWLTVLLFRTVRVGDAWDARADTTGQELPSLRAVMAYAMPLVVTAASFFIFTSSDILILQMLGSESDVGIYGAAVRLIEAGHVLSIAVGSGVAVYFVRGLNDGTSGALFRRTTQSLLSLYAPLAVLIAVCAPEIVALLFGPDFSTTALVLRLYIPYFLVKALTPTYALALDYMGEAGRRAIAFSLAALANVILNFILIPEYGVAGAAMATQITFIPIAFWYAYYLSRRCGVSAGDIISSFRPILLAVGAMVVVVMLLRLRTTSIWILVPLGVSAYLIALWRMGGISDVLSLMQVRTHSRKPANV